jgi:hypothetical protein
MCLDERGVVLCFYMMQLGVGGSVCGRANIPKDIEDHRYIQMRRIEIGIARDSPYIMQLISRTNRTKIGSSVSTTDWPLHHHPCDMCSAMHLEI